MNDDLFDELVRFEQGSMGEAETVEFFQRLIDDGVVWRLQGSYARMASALIEAGRCMLGPIGRRDYFGNYVPSRFEVKPGTPGSPEFADTSRDRR